MKLKSAGHHKLLLAFLGLGLAVLFWAINAVIAKGVTAQVKPMALSFFRWFAALMFILPFAAKGLGKDRIPIRENLGFLFLLSIPSVAIYNSVLYLGAQYTTATNIALMVAVMPAMTLGFAWAINQKPPKMIQVLGILISLGGVLVILSKGSLSLFFDFRFNPGDLLILVSIASWALYSVSLKKRPLPISPISFLTMIIVFGTLVILPFYVWEYYYYQGFEVTPPIVWMFVYLGICPSILSYICWNHGVKTVGAGTAAVFMSLIPVFTAVIAYFFLGERLFPFHLAGGLLIFFGLILSSRQ
jgi:drug/metabolite transporter (DMT)-like permease